MISVLSRRHRRVRSPWACACAAWCGDRDAGNVDRVAHDRGLALMARRGFQIVGLILALDVEFGSRLDLGGLRGGLGHLGLAPARLDRTDAKYLLSKRPHLLQALGPGKTKKRF